MFKLQIEVTSIEDAERILACLKHSADPAAVKQVEAQINPKGESGEVNPPVDEKPKNPRGRPRRQVAEPLPESAAPAPEADAPQSDSSSNESASEPAQQTFTLADIRGALQAVQAKNPSDMQPVIGLLAKFGAARVSDVKVEDYAKFIDACNKAS